MNSIQKLALVKSFLARHDLDLQNGCLQLGGPPALGRLQRFRRAVATAERLSSDHRRSLSWIQELFGLERVHDLDFEEAEYFVAVEMEDPFILGVCEVTEALDALLIELGQPGDAQSRADIAAA
ncbi:hypothetical protein [Salipiger thiooxidans]|uniref:hypothetical protein n=1 Tax=Salipiger thiooxidans TaxID=282683 RepID=UPI001CFBAB29|nr:hypothetical protein [Salipiger thiooxidans]